MINFAPVMNQSNLTLTALHYGVISGLAVFTFYFLLYATGNNLFGPASMLGVWIPVVFIVLATRSHRDQNLGGSLSYGQGVAIGIMTTVFSVTLFGLSFYLFGVLYAAELIEFYKSQAAEGLERGKDFVSEALLDKALEGLEQATMSSLAFSESFNKFLWGGVVSLVTAGVMRKKGAVTENSDWQ
jgi:hypothetical protein